MKKGQVSTEYLVILAVILVIALVLVYVVSQGTGLGTSTLESQSQAYWRGTQPLSITEFSAAGTALTLSMKNNMQDIVTLTQVTGTGLTPYTTTTSFQPGQTSAITVTLAAPCVSGPGYAYANITFTYNFGAVTGKTFVGQRPLAGSCV